MADTTVDDTLDTEQKDDGGPWGAYWLDPLIGAIIFRDSGDSMEVARTEDGGNTYALTAIDANIKQYACWFDQETPGDSGTLLHVAWIDASGGDSAAYISYDLNADSLGTRDNFDTTITAASGPSENRIAITKTVSGNLIAAFSTQSEIECYRSTDGGSNWTDIADVYETATEEDWVLLFPADTADNDDACAIFWDRSASALSVKMWDNSAGSWTETSISTGMTASQTQKHFDGAVRHSDGHIIVAAHNTFNDATDDLKVWDITPDSIATPTVTALTDVFTNQAASTQAAVMINQQNDDIYVAYLKGGTWTSAMDVVYHVSDDGGSTWGTEQAYSEATADDIRNIGPNRTVGNNGGRFQPCWYNDDLVDLFVNEVNDVAIAAVSTGIASMRQLVGVGQGTR